MLKFLLIEDDRNKANRIKTFVDHEWNTKCTVAESLISGLRTAILEKPNIVLLDMTLPNYDGPTDVDTNTMHAFGGIEFLRQAERRKIKCNAIVITQFETFGEAPHLVMLDDLQKQLKDEFSEIYGGITSYHASHSLWEDDLRTFVSSCGV